MSYLNREASGLPPELWDEIDKAAVKAAQETLTARRFLEMEGPFGPGLTSLEVGSDRCIEEPSDDEASAIFSRALSVPMFRKSFGLSVRRIEAHLQLAQPLDLTPVQDAAEAVARREERSVYKGQPDVGLDGLLTVEGRNRVTCGDWSSLEQALTDTLQAVNTLDAAGYHGPYAFALPPRLYNALFRRYEGSDMLQVEHLRRLCELGVYKAAIDVAVLVDPHVGNLVLGQDLMAGYSGNDGIHYQLYINESIVLRIEEPRAICVLEGS